MVTCPACGQENPDGFRHCGMCGAVLDATPAATGEERKVVTILFTDLVGSTARAERLDPEDVRATLSSYYARLRAELERYGGTVEKFIGDAVMAVFGAPVAHEDDPERAVRAAVAIRGAVGTDLEIRTAVNTGEALVALGARTVEGEGMVSGDVVNTAARLQSAAPVNGILVGETTYRATRNVIDYREAPPVEAKGKSRPIPVWEVVAVRSRLGSDVEEQLQTPLVGRERERSLLVETFARTRTEQSAQLLTLVGVPGIGKSRLVAELLQVVEAEPDLIAWRQGRSLPYGESGSYWALGEIVKSHAGILDSDSLEEAEAKFVETVTGLAADEGERAWLALHARPLLGLEGGAERPERDEAFAAWRRLLEAAAEQRPLVLVFEDLHWADDGLLDFVDHLADWATTVPLLIVGTARPELLDRRPGWGGGKRNAFTLSIGALTDEDIARLLQHLLDQAVLDADAQQAVLRRAEGNPLYAEEYARLLAEHDGAGDLPLPETVQGLIAARIDALPPEEKTLLQDASVIGKVFWPGALGNPDERLVHSLERKEFVRRDRRSSIAGETQYAFRHALVRDVAYGQIPRPRRVEKHRRAAQWIASLAPDRGEDRAEMLAHHYREALALGSAAGIDVSDLRGPAQKAFAEAAARALSLSAWAAAVQLGEEALELTDPGAPDRPRIQLNVAYATWYVARNDPELIASAVEGFLALEDLASAAEASALLARVLGNRGDAAGSQAAAERAVDLARRVPSSPGTARAIVQSASIAIVQQRDSATAIELAREALVMAERIGDASVAARALNTIGLARVHDGDEDGIHDLERSVEVSLGANASGVAGSALNNLAAALGTVGRLSEGFARVNDARTIYERHGSAASLIWNDAAQVEYLDVLGDLDGVLEGAATYLSHPDAEDRYTAPSILAARARALLARGEVGPALDDAERALGLLRARGHDAQMSGGVLAAGARCARAAGRDEEANALLEQCLEWSRLASEDSFYDLPLHLVELARGDEYLALVETREGYLWQQAARAAVTGDLGAAAELYGRIGAAFVEAWAGLLAAEREDTSRLDSALVYFEAQRATPYAERCRALLQASA
ncbi:MAG TPA: AAA family ATPase [Gaiellaceae bacterium]|nr:AAA family ATPase [Gaiellaceae bacterium]